MRQGCMVDAISKVDVTVKAYCKVAVCMLVVLAIVTAILENAVDYMRLEEEIAHS
jgi:hypothetical protein